MYCNICDKHLGKARISTRLVKKEARNILYIQFKIFLKNGKNLGKIKEIEQSGLKG